MIRVSSYSASAFAESLRANGGKVTAASNFHAADLPRTLGKGRWEQVQIAPGLELSITNQQSSKPTTWSVLVKKPVFSFAKLIEGHCGVSAKGEDHVTEISDGFCASLCSTEGEQVYRMHAQKYVMVAIQTDFEILSQQERFAGLVDQRSLVSLISTPRPLLTHKESSPLIDEMCRRVARTPQDEPLRGLLLESCALTLLAEQVSLLTRSKPEKTCSLSRREREAIHAVRAYLLANPSDSPSLAQLAQLGGTNEFSLKQAFRSEYGETVYGFLRRHRLQLADRMLQDGDRSVAEIAGRLGYACSGRFASAFRRAYGVTPKQRQIAHRA